MAGSDAPLRMATINGSRIAVARGQTLLDAALAAGLALPYGCRVGGCGTCRCRLLQGRVHERTETAYLFDAAELAARTILACQSEPLTDVTVAVDVHATVTRRQVSGRVVEQTRLAPSVTRLVVRLDQGLPYRPGQHAQLSLARLPGEVRSYSFASPPGTEPLVEFHLRHIPGGVFSSVVAGCKLIGESAVVDGPLGNFTLCDGNGALLFVTTGTGLAPVLAMLEAAAASDARSVTWVHGARTCADLYALPRIDAIARAWRGGFRFVPVLSRPDADWRGARGRVGDVLDGLVDPALDAYLCGAPAMVDEVRARLLAQGLSPRQIHADRHVTRAEARSVAADTLAVPLAPSAAQAGSHAPRGAQSPPARTIDRDAGVVDYLKFFLFHLVGLYAAAALIAGGAWTTLGLLAVVAFYVGGDALLGDDRSAPRYRHPGLLSAQLWAALPLLALIVFAAVWSVSPGDPLGFGAAVHALTGWDALAARAASHFGHQVSAVILTGLMIGMIGTITAHELVHRTWDPASVAIGRALLAFSFDTVFAIEHVHGHHRYVATPQDPATAPRGRHVYAHILASTWRSNRSAWRIEALRLERRGLPVLGWRNRVLRGHLASLALVALAYAIGGWAGAGFFVASALVGKALLEIVNYMEHYGLVRDPATPVAARHSWNTNRRISSWSMFNLTRHSHHHAQGEVPYQNLKPLPDAPVMPFGYLTTIIIALIPPLWHRLMTPRLLAWDREQATAAERRLAAAANRRSGVPALLRQAGNAVGP